MDKRLLIPGFIIVLIGAGIAVYNPYSGLSRVHVTFEGVILHKASTSSTIFIVSTKVTNPTNNPVTVSGIEASMLINGTDYYSMALGGNTYTVPPGDETLVSTPVMNTGSPVGYQPDGTTRRYMLNSTITFKLSTSSLGISAEKTASIAKGQRWTYCKDIPPPDGLDPNPSPSHP